MAFHHSLRRDPSISGARPPDTALHRVNLPLVPPIQKSKGSRHAFYLASVVMLRNNKGFTQGSPHLQPYTKGADTDVRTLVS